MQDKSRLLHVLRYLERKSDEHHPITISNISKYLETIGIKANRRTISDDIEALIKFGTDIVTIKSTQKKYFIGERKFQVPELKLLIDAVISSRFISEKKSIELIEKLKTLTSEHQISEIQIDNTIKTKNESVLLNTDTIISAISNKKQISFQYHELIPNKTLKPKDNGYVYKLSPYKLIWNQDKYYCLGFLAKYNKILAFRIELMCQVNTTSNKYTPCPSNFVVADYLKQTFDMCDGKNIEVTLKCKSELMDVIVDKFGEGVNTTIIDNNCFQFTTKVYISQAFYSWIFQFTNSIIIMSPKRIIDEYKKILKNTIEKLN